MAEENFEEQNLGEVQEKDSVTENSNPLEEVEKAENDVTIVEEKRWPGWPGENVFRILVPIQTVGGIIGRKGDIIKKICEETKARIKILDGPPGTTERTVLISAKEEPDLPIPPALDGLLKIHKRIVDPNSDPSSTPSGGAISTRLLVAASQGGSLIGKQGTTIKTIQDDSGCIIRVLGGDNLPVFALPDDSVVEIQGDTAGVHKALELIANHLRKFLVDRSVIGIFETQMQKSNVRGNQNMPPSESWGPPESFPMSHDERNHPFMPPRPYDNYYPDMPLENPPRSGAPTYGREMAARPSSQPQQAVIAKVTQIMRIPLSYADAVIGVNGANISYIRRASGATIAIQESRGNPDEMNVEIDGSASQVQAAQQLIQNYIAEAASSVQNSGGGAQSQGGYNQQQQYAPASGLYGGAAYGTSAPHGTGYAPPPSNAGASGQAAGHAPTGDYASMYGHSYGYQ